MSTFKYTNPALFYTYAMFGFGLFYLGYCVVVPPILFFWRGSQAAYLAYVVGTVLMGWKVGECIMLIASS